METYYYKKVKNGYQIRLASDPKVSFVAKTKEGFIAMKKKEGIIAQLIHKP